MQFSGNDSIPRSRRVAIIVVMLLLLYVIGEIVAYLGLRFLESIGKQAYAPTLTTELSEQHREILTRVVNGEAKYIGYSRDLGWTTLPNGENELYRANSQGVRGTRVYDQSPPEGMLRIATFGDSYIHGDDVPNSSAWSILMEQKAADVEVMNFGVGGYGPDQGYLRYLKEGPAYSPHIVFIGYQTENINRVVNVFRPFYSPKTGNPLAKPYFSLVDGELILNENPMQSLSDYRDLLDDPESVLSTMSEDDFHYKFRYTPGPLDWSPAMRLIKAFFFEFKSRYMSPFYEGGKYRTSFEAYQLVDAIIRDFHCDALTNGSLPVVVLFPHRADLEDVKNGGTPQYAPLKDELLAAGYPVIDLAEAFRPLLGEMDVRDLTKAHYTHEGNDAVADYLLAEIEAAGWANEDQRNELMAVQAGLCRQ